MQVNKKLIEIAAGHLREMPWVSGYKEVVSWVGGDLVYQSSRPRGFGIVGNSGWEVGELIDGPAVFYCRADSQSCSREIVLDFSEAARWAGLRDGQGREFPALTELERTPKFGVLQGVQDWDYTPVPLSVVLPSAAELVWQTALGWAGPARPIEKILNGLEEAVAVKPALRWAPVGIWIPAWYYKAWREKKKGEKAER